MSLNTFDRRLLEDQTMKIGDKEVRYSTTPHMQVLNDRVVTWKENTGELGNFLMGAFEIYFMGVRIYSKKQSNIWPSVPMVVEKCIKAHSDFMSGEDISIYETFAGLKRNDVTEMKSMKPTEMPKSTRELD